QEGGVEEAGVIESVLDDDAAATGEGRYQPQVGLVPGAEDQRRWLTHERGEPRLQLLVHVEGAIEEAASGAAGAVAVKRLLSLLEDVWVMGQPQVIVGADHDLPLSANDHFRVERFPDRLEVGVDATGYRLAGGGETAALLKEVGATLHLGFRLRCSHLSPSSACIPANSLGDTPAQRRRLL